MWHSLTQQLGESLQSPGKSKRFISEMTTDSDQDTVKV